MAVAALDGAKQCKLEYLVIMAYSTDGKWSTTTEHKTLIILIPNMQTAVKYFSVKLQYAMNRIFDLDDFFSPCRPCSCFGASSHSDHHSHAQNRWWDCLHGWCVWRWDNFLSPGHLCKTKPCSHKIFPYAIRYPPAASCYLVVQNGCGSEREILPVVGFECKWGYFWRCWLSFTFLTARHKSLLPKNRLWIWSGGVFCWLYKTGAA